MFRRNTAGVFLAFLAGVPVAARARTAPPLEVPEWRDRSRIAYRPNEELAMSVAARYSGSMYSILDDTDMRNGVTGAFEAFLVADADVRYRVSECLTAAAGIDNVFNRRDQKFHPFPGRTWQASAKLKF